MLSFPDIKEPNLSISDNCGSSYSLSYDDNKISSKTDGGYELTRPRNTRMIKTFTYSWIGLSYDDFETLQKFYEKVGTFQSFKFVNWQDERTYEVRFSEPLKDWQDNYPAGWQGSLSFKEV